MNFNSIVDKILKEEDFSKEDKLNALKAHNKSASFKFSFVAWDHRDEIPYDEIDRIRETNQFPYEYDTNLGSDATYVFFADIKLSESVCNTLMHAIVYIDILEDILEYDGSCDCYTSYAPLDVLKQRAIEADNTNI